VGGRSGLWRRSVACLRQADGDDGASRFDESRCTRRLFPGFELCSKAPDREADPLKGDRVGIGHRSEDREQGQNIGESVALHRECRRFVKSSKDSEVRE
jgi:hypothetical protein